MCSSESASEGVSVRLCLVSRGVSECVSESSKERKSNRAKVQQHMQMKFYFFFLLVDWLMNPFAFPSCNQ